MEHDYARHGFAAASRADELAGPDYEARITRSSVDVSARVLAATTAGELDPGQQSAALRAVMKQIEAETEAALAGSPSLRCELVEMWPFRSYTLFTYEILRDVRVVYVPPGELAEFGGDIDNFEWPRHKADFTLLRAYVAPDGSSAEPSPDNVPYKPTAHLGINPAGASAGDFVFLLGYPGNTMRYAPSCRLAFADEVAVPAQVKDFGRKLDLIKEHATTRAYTLKLMTARRRLANEWKRCSGKRMMMRKLALLDERRAEETALVAAVPEAAAVLRGLEEVYAGFRARAELSQALDALRGAYFGSTTLYAAYTLHQASIQMALPDAERRPGFQAKNHGYLLRAFGKRVGDVVPELELALLKDAVETARAAGLTTAVDAIGADVCAAAASSTLLAHGTEVRAEAALTGPFCPHTGRLPRIPRCVAVLPQPIRLPRRKHQNNAAATTMLTSAACGLFHKRISHPYPAQPGGSVHRCSPLSWQAPGLCWTTTALCARTWLLLNSQLCWRRRRNIFSANATPCWRCCSGCRRPIPALRSTLTRMARCASAPDTWKGTSRPMR